MFDNSFFPYFFLNKNKTNRFKYTEKVCNTPKKKKKKKTCNTEIDKNKKKKKNLRYRDRGGK